MQTFKRKPHLVEYKKGVGIGEIDLIKYVEC